MPARDVRSRVERARAHLSATAVEVSVVRPNPHAATRDTGEQSRRHYRTFVTPGQLDESASFVFTTGQCHSMAAALSERTGWPVVILVERTEYPYGGTDDMIRHLYVETPEGTWVDVNGEHDPQMELEIVEEDLSWPGGYGEQSALLVRTDAAGARGLASREGCARLGLESEVSLLPTCMPVARSLVDEVLDQAGWLGDWDAAEVAG